MYNNWTENVVLRRYFLAQGRRSKSFICVFMFWESIFKKIFKNDDQKCYKNSIVNELRCLGTYFFYINQC